MENKAELDYGSFCDTFQEFLDDIIIINYLHQTLGFSSESFYCRAFECYENDIRVTVDKIINEFR
jgi:hypothetical protein